MPEAQPLLSRRGSSPPRKNRASNTPPPTPAAPPPPAERSESVRRSCRPPAPTTPPQATPLPASSAPPSIRFHLNAPQHQLLLLAPFLVQLLQPRALLLRPRIARALINRQQRPVRLVT